MNAPFPTNPATNSIKEDIRILADDSLKAARDHIVDPMIHSAQQAGASTKEAVQAAKTLVIDQAGRAEQYASQQCDRTVTWLSANPLTGVGIGFAIGVALTTLMGSASRR